MIGSQPPSIGSFMAQLVRMSHRHGEVIAKSCIHNCGGYGFACFLFSLLPFCGKCIFKY